MSGTPSAVLWVHDAMLSDRWLRAGEPAVFVFDDRWIAEAGLCLKRLVFMAECLEALPGVEVRRGDVVEEIREFAAGHQAGRVRTVAAVDPRLRHQIAALADAPGVEVVSPPALVDRPVPDADLRSFSRYWKKHGDAARRPR